MVSKLLGTLLLGALAIPAYATDIYRWTDETGRVNYGNEVPARFKSVARKIDTSGTQVTVNNGQRQNPQAARPADPSASTGSGTPPPVGPGGVGY
jgi:hypothetical protein